MPAMATADLKAVLPQAAKHNLDQNVRLEHLRKNYCIPTSYYRQGSGLVIIH